jgi:hypothetical protein
MASFQAWTEPHSGLSLWACILLPYPTQYLAVYYSGSGFTPNAFLLSGWLLTNVQVNNTTALHEKCAHMYIHHIGITILLFFLYIFHSSWQADWSRPIPSDTLTIMNMWHLTIQSSALLKIILVLELWASAWHSRNPKKLNLPIFLTEMWSNICRNNQKNLYLVGSLTIKFSYRPPTYFSTNCGPLCYW